MQPWKSTNLPFPILGTFLSSPNYLDLFFAFPIYTQIFFSILFTQMESNGFSKHWTVLFFFSFSFSFFLMATSTAYGSSRVRIESEPQLQQRQLCQAGDPTCTSSVTRATAVRFLTDCTTAGTLRTDTLLLSSKK